MWAISFTTMEIIPLRLVANAFKMFVALGKINMILSAGLPTKLFSRHYTSELLLWRSEDSNANEYD